MSTYTVIIIGGSIAGLALANALEKYGIEYILFEKHEMIAPQLGASVATLPYGAHILEQLGCYEQCLSHSLEVDALKTFDATGKHLNVRDKGVGFGAILEEIAGYKMAFLDRCELIQSLYDNLKDKSKIHTSSALLKIEQLDDQVTVVTKNGTFTGDIVVGADGVHSRTREEMWCIAQNETPEYPVERMRNSMICLYKCMFGIAECPEGLTGSNGFKTYHKNRSYLYQIGPGGKMYFFAFFKNPEKTVHRDIPRYTEDDHQAVMEEFGNDILFPGLTFGDLYNRRRTAVLVPLEEYVLEKCFYKRAVLIGDSFHKMNPLTGNGGNSAIESAALLGDLIKEALDKHGHLTDDVLQSQLFEFEKKRRPRATALMENSRMLQSVEALETPFLEFLNLKVMKWLTLADMIPVLASVTSPAHSLRYLPRPSHRGAVARDDEVVAEPSERSWTATVFWGVLMVLIACLKWIIPSYFSVHDAALQSSVSQMYTLIVSMAISGMWMVESYRGGRLPGPLCIALPYMLALTVVGWDVILPIYCALFIYKSKPQAFYYPLPRTIHIDAAKALVPGLLLAYSLPVLYTLFGPVQSIAPININRIFQVAHITFSVFVLWNQIREKTSSTMKLGELIFGNRDMPHLSTFYNVLFFLTSTIHLTVCSKGLAAGFSQDFLVSGDSVRLGCLTLAIIAWCLFSAWDMNRVNAVRTPLVLIFIVVLVGTIMVGPAATLIGFWKWRECALEASRQTK